MDYVNSVKEMRLLKRKEKVQKRKYDIAKASFLRYISFKVPEARSIQIGLILQLSRALEIF